MTAQILNCPRLSTHTHSHPSKLLRTPKTHPGQLLKSAGANAQWKLASCKDLA